MNAAIADDSTAISDRRRSGGFFLIGGVIMFFDRAMYAQHSLACYLQILTQPRLAMGNVREPHF